MQINPAHHLDLRLQEIDQQINTALRDIRRNMQELEKASSTTPARPGSADQATTRPAKDFSTVLQETLDSESEPVA